MEEWSSYVSLLLFNHLNLQILVLPLADLTYSHKHILPPRIRRFYYLSQADFTTSLLQIIQPPTNRLGYFLLADFNNAYSQILLQYFLSADFTIFHQQILRPPHSILLHPTSRFDNLPREVKGDLFWLPSRLSVKFWFICRLFPLNSARYIK